jgi:negative regulator of genetic competence, sporulation and motility
MTKTITINDLHKYSEDVQELFRNLVEGIVAEELFAGSDPEYFDLEDFKLNLELTVDVGHDAYEFEDEGFDDFGYSDDDIDLIYR